MAKKNVTLTAGSLRTAFNGACETVNSAVDGLPDETVIEPGDLRCYPGLIAVAAYTKKWLRDDVAACVFGRPVTDDEFNRLCGAVDFDNIVNRAIDNERSVYDYVYDAIEKEVERWGISL